MSKVAAKDLQIGNIVVAYYYNGEPVLYGITRKQYDPKGNTGNQPRYLIDMEPAHCQAVPDHMKGWNGCGCLPEEEFKIIEGQHSIVATKEFRRNLSKMLGL